MWCVGKWCLCAVYGVWVSGVCGVVFVVHVSMCDAMHVCGVVFVVCG